MSRNRTGGRTRAVVSLALSAVTAALASAAIGGVVLRYARELDGVGAEPLAPVLVASHDVWQGKTLDAADLRLKDLPPAYVPDAVLRDPGQVVGRVPRERILADEFIRGERLADPAAGVGLNAIIPRGMRAMSLDVSDGSAVSGFVEPGNYVDVLVTLDATDGQEAETTTLLQAATVLAVDERLGGEGRGRPAVTLAVTPDAAEKLTHAIAEGSVTLTLRSDIDVTAVETHGARSTDLLGPAQTSVPDLRRATDAASGRVIHIISGTQDRVEPAE